MRSRWFAGAALVAAMVVGLAPLASAAPASQRSVWVLGDSVVAGATEPLHRALHGWDATVRSFIGLPTRQAIDVMRESRDRGELGAVVVVQLGLNDWGLADGAYQRLVDEAMGVLEGHHVVWLTSPRFRPEMDRVNGAIRAAVARHPNLEVLEWGPLSDAHPEATYSDGIHLRPAGQRLLAGAVAGAVNAWWSGRCAVDPAAAESAVARLYLAYFLRPPDAAGRAYWTGKAASGELCLGDISELFAGSPEFTGTYGALGVPEFVRLVYVNVLGREPDPDGYTYWATLLAAGQLRRGDVMTVFSESPEFRVRTSAGSISASYEG
jgi:hypothetical protein